MTYSKGWQQWWLLWTELIPITLNVDVIHGDFVPHASAPLAHGSGGAFASDGRGSRRYALFCSFFSADVPCALRAWSPLVGAAVAALVPSVIKVKLYGAWY